LARPTRVVFQFFVTMLQAITVTKAVSQWSKLDWESRNNRRRDHVLYK
jgi:hypothetical protein